MVKQGKLIHSGKANDIYTTDYREFLILDHSDRISAGNGAKKDIVSGKGKSNNAVSASIFKLLEIANVPTHYVEVYSETAMVINKADMILLEVIGRNETWGSFCKRYGCKKGILIQPVGIEFCLKSDELGDPFISEWAISTLGIASQWEIIEIKKYTVMANAVMRDFFGRLGLRLIDFKLEFGRLADGSVVVCDEISLDTCRLIDEKTGENVDKDRFRNDMGGVQEVYQEILKRL